MPSAFDVLARDHEEVKRMLTELELGPTAATGADGDQLALRRKMVQLVIEESRHEAVEEMHFWPVVRAGQRRHRPGQPGTAPGAGGQGSPRQAGQA